MSRNEIIATYHIASYITLERAAEVLAGEQSSGTFARVALESEELSRNHRAVIRSISPLPDSPNALPGSRGTEGANLAFGLVTIAFPFRNIGSSIPALLTAVAGNLYEIPELAAVKLIDVDLPLDFADCYQGPREGLEGTRALMGVDGGAMIGTIIKPSIGLSLESLAGLVRELALAGIDFIKDDELNSNPPYAPLAERVRIVMREIEAAAQVTGKKVMYAFNITDEIDKMKAHADIVTRLGGNCAMVAIPSVGLPALKYLRDNYPLVLHGHRAGFAALDRNPNLGMSFKVFQKLARLAGADHVHVGGINGKFWESNGEIVDNFVSLQAPLLSTRPVVPVLSSGQTAANAFVAHKLLASSDVLVLAGGGIHAHPGGAGDGVASLRRAWQLSAAGENPASRASEGSALAVALKTFGPS